MDKSLTRIDLVTAAVIALGAFAVFWLSPVHYVADSRYQMLFSQQLLWNHSFSVDAKMIPDLPADKPIQSLKRGVDFRFHLERYGDRFYCWFPPGSTILSMPFVALANAAGISTIDRAGSYNEPAEQQIQTVLAPLLMAGLCAIIFLTSRMLLNFTWSLIVALATAFGSPIWSIASRAMWIHTWGIFLLGIVVWLLVRLDTGRGRPHPVILATCLSWLYFVRPTFSISIVAVAVYLVVYHRSAFLSFALTGGGWLALFIAYSWSLFGHLLPDYYRSQRYGFSFGANFWEGLAGTLISPSRGLFIYTPILLLVIFWTVRYRRYASPRLTILAAAVICAHVLVISGYTQWEGGWCYGPRYCTDIVPWFALLGMAAVAARQRCQLAHPASAAAVGRRIEWAVASLLLLCTVTLHGMGGMSFPAWNWNALARNNAEFRARLWDWKHPPFLNFLHKI